MNFLMTNRGMVSCCLLHSDFIEISIVVSWSGTDQELTGITFYPSGLLTNILAFHESYRVASLIADYNKRRKEKKKYNCKF